MLWFAAALSSSHAVEPAAPRAIGHPAGRERIDFTRVHVPAGRLSDVELGATRYVPMSAREFEEGIASFSGPGKDVRRGTARPLLQPLADAARYDMTLADDGSLVGTLSFDIGGPSDSSGGTRSPQRGVAREMPLGTLEVRSGSMRTAAGIGEAVVFGRRDGTLAVRTPDAGAYSLEFRCMALPGAEGRERYSLPLVPALFSSISLRLPAGMEPVVDGDIRARPSDARPPASIMSPRAGQEAAEVLWQIDTGPRKTLELSWIAGATPSPRVAMWTTLAIRGRQSSLCVHVQPKTPWLRDSIRIEKDASVLVTEVSVGRPMDRAGDVSWSVIDGGTAVAIDLPPRYVESLAPILIEAVAPVAERAAPLPMLRPPIEDWAGGGTAIEITSSLTFASVELERCLVVPPEVAARWPLPGRPRAGAGEAAMPDVARGEGGQAGLAHAASDDEGQERDRNEQARAAPGVRPSRLFIEDQAPRPTVTVSLLPRIADMDVARVTTVDLSPVVVVGRAACDVQVRRGDAFDVTARITPGWFIDSVEVIALAMPLELADARERVGVDEPGTAIDWKVIRDARGDTLRIGLITAVTPARGLGLRITGHRAGIPLGEEFSTAEVDMVRFEGESERSSIVDLRTSPETTVEVSHDHEPALEPTSPVDPTQSDFHALAPDGRLAALMEDGATRARLWAGFQAASRNARLVRRRPPLDARTQVRLTVRDDRLTESLTFECHPSAADLDSIVVQFSAAVDDPFEWSLLPPAIGSVSARKLESSERRTGPGGGALGGERWLVEVNPPAREPVSIRAARTTPFTRAMPVLLAWVDGATSSVGHCIVRNVGRVAPTVENRRLREVPPEAPGDMASPATLAEFAFGPEDAFDPTEVAAAELVPGGGEGRAWVWREITSSWCFASGATECESRFDIENRGRTSLSLSLSAGRRVQGILLDGVPLPLGERVAVGGQFPIELPGGRHRMTLVVRTCTAGGGAGGGPWSSWFVDASPATLDIPILQRVWRLFLPPVLDIAMVRGGDRITGDAASRDWLARLFAVRRYPGPSSTRTVEQHADGFRGVLIVPSGDAGREAGVVVVPSRVLSGATVLAVVVAAATTLLAARMSLRGAVLVCLLAGVTALWAFAPFDGIARSAWWACLAALGLTVRDWPRRWHGASLALGTARVRGILPLFLVVWSLIPAGEAAADERGGSAPEASATPVADVEPLRVFVTPIDAGGDADERGDATVLVPESLFRALARGEDGGDAAAVRVLRVRVMVPVPPQGDGRWTSWRVEFDVDADSGGILPLDQAAGDARFLPGTLRIDGAVALVRGVGDAGGMRLVVPDAGRHTVSVDVEPSSRRSGDVEVATIAIPAAPEASLHVPPSAAADRVVCERATENGFFMAAARQSHGTAGDSFDVARSAQVRLVRPVKPQCTIAAFPPTVASRNDIFWNLDECRVTGSYDIGAGDTIVRSVVVRADPGLEWIPPADQGQEPAADAADGVSIRPLGGDRFLVEPRRPERGRWRFEASFRMPLADAVGVFDVPGAWVEHALVDTRSVRFVASPSLAVRIDLPPGLVHADTPDGDASFETRFWRGEVSRAITVEDVAGRSASSATGADRGTQAPRARLSAERRRQDIRGLQREVVVFGDDQVRVHLDARLDASSTALVTIPLEVPAGCVVDRVELSEDDLLHPETAERGAVDLRWTRPGDTSVNVVVQRPQAGRFRLEVDARIPGRPAARGPLPGIRVDLADVTRSIVEWRSEDGLAAAVENGTVSRDADDQFGIATRSGRLESTSDAAPPSYRLEAAPVVESSNDVESAAVAMPRDRIADGVARIELADIRLAVDERGRAWGVAAFELVTTEPVVRLQLPRSWRLFDAVVDGRSVDCVVPASPVADTVWEVPMLEADRPRSIVALFVGDLFVGDVGRRLLDGEPLVLTPPTIQGLPCRRVVWTLRVPAGIALRVAAPATLVDAEALQAERLAARRRMEADAQRAIERSIGWGQDRMRTFLASRDGGTPAADEVWAQASTASTTPLSLPAVTYFMRAGDGEDNADAGQLAIRAVRLRDPTTKGRAIATLSILAGGCLAWIAARRSSSPRPSTVGPPPAIETGDVGQTTTINRGRR